MAGLRVGQVFGVLLLPGFEVGSSSPQVPGHPASMCDSAVNLGFQSLTISFFDLWYIINSPLFRTEFSVVIASTTSCLGYLNCARSFLLVFLLVILDYSLFLHLCAP